VASHKITLKKNILGSSFFLAKFWHLMTKTNPVKLMQKSFEGKKKKKEKEKAPKFTKFEECVSDIIAISVQWVPAGRQNI